MILLLAAALAAATPPCPTEATAPAYVCQALAAEQAGQRV